MSQVDIYRQWLELMYINERIDLRIFIYDTFVGGIPHE